MPHLLAAARRPAGFFLRVMLCRSRNRQSELRLVLIRRLRSSATISNKVRSGCSATSARISVANCSSGEMLPPRGFGAALLFSRQRCSHLTAEATLTSKCSAASRRDAPASTASITRSRSSPENDCGIVRPPQANQCTKTLLSVFLWESPRFKSGGNRFSVSFVDADAPTGSDRKITSGGSNSGGTLGGVTSGSQDAGRLDCREYDEADDSGRSGGAT